MTQPPVPKGARTFDSIQYLRALAALMVVVYHVLPRLEHMGYAGDWPGWLSCGVDVFFVISGFIMWTTTCERPMRPFEFLARRFLRIAPLYYLVTAVVVAIMAIAPSLVSSGKLDLGHTLASFAFFPHLNAGTGDFDPVLPQGWTLNYEMEFYALFAIALLVARPFRQILILVALLAVVGLGHLVPRMSTLGFYSDSIILEFGFGVVVAVAIAGGVRVPAALALACVVAGAAAIVLTWPIVTSGVPRVWLSGLGAAALVFGAVGWEVERGGGVHRVARLLGDASYSTYLTHSLVLTAVACAWSHSRLATLPGSMVAFAIVGVLAASVGGIVVYELAERPLHRFARARTRRPPPAGDATPSIARAST